MPRVILLLPTATYRAPDFLAAARRLGIDVVVASEQAQALAAEMGDRALVVPFAHPVEAADALVAAATAHPVEAIVAVDETGVIPAAMAAERLGLPHNPPEAVAATRTKARLRHLLEEACVPQPRFAVLGLGSDPEPAVAVTGLPCVVKPSSLAASRGVIRVDTAAEVQPTVERVRAIIGEAAGEAAADGTPAPDPTEPILVEEYIDGVEVAVEGILRDGALEVLAVFDKPEPMTGPYFAETLLVTPSRLPGLALERVERVVASAAAAVGLREGPVHAEARVARDEVRMLELAARSIGGLCARTLRFGAGLALEDVILAHAAGLPIGALDRPAGAAGVAMLYAPARGRLVAVDGVTEAEAVDGIEGVELTARPGAQVAPLPDSARYLGFVFARGPDPEGVERALIDARRRIDIVVDEA